MPLQTYAADTGIVDIVILPATSTINVGATSDLTIQIQPNKIFCDRIEVYLDFNPAQLEVKLTMPATTSDTIMKNQFDNNTGTLDFVVESQSKPFKTENFTLVFVTFKGKSAAASSAISFHKVAGDKDLRVTNVISSGKKSLRNTTGATISVQGATAPTPSPKVLPSSGPAPTSTPPKPSLSPSPVPSSSVSSPSSSPAQSSATPANPSPAKPTPPPEPALSSKKLMPDNQTPTRLTTKAGFKKAELVWVDNCPDESGYYIDRSPDGANWSTIATTDAMDGFGSYMDKAMEGKGFWGKIIAFFFGGLDSKTTYYYRVQAFNKSYKSKSSNEASVTTK